MVKTLDYAWSDKLLGLSSSKEKITLRELRSKNLVDAL
ncbi:hypothetical protein [Aeromonas phage Akh-2]|nr:hypothetical protein [Aeromonas phage Akh-2]